MKAKEIDKIKQEMAQLQKTHGEITQNRQVIIGEMITAALKRHEEMCRNLFNLEAKHTFLDGQLKKLEEEQKDDGQNHEPDASEGDNDSPTESGATERGDTGNQGEPEGNKS